MAESARLESVCRRKTILGSNPSPTVYPERVEGPEMMSKSCLTSFFIRQRVKLSPKVRWKERMMQCKFCERTFEGEGVHPGTEHEQGCPAYGHDSTGGDYPNDLRKHWEFSTGRWWGVCGAPMPKDASESLRLGYRQGECRRIKEHQRLLDSGQRRRTSWGRLS